MQPNNTGLYFTVTTAIIDDNRSLKKGVRDKDGYFTNVPVAVLGTVTRNNTQYDTEAFIGQIKGPDTSFYKRLTEGNLFSEWGHCCVDLNSQAGMERLMNLDPQKKSNHIRSVSVKHIADLGLDMIVMDTKGAGPYGKYHDEAMLDPTMNIAYSLRGISTGMIDPKTKVIKKKLVNLVTFDAGVASGGFKEASKRYMTSVENLSYQSEELVNHHITQNDLVMVRNVAMESFTNSELNDLMKSNKVVIGQVITGYVDRATHTIIDPESKNQRSLFHSFIKVRR